MNNPGSLLSEESRTCGGEPDPIGARDGYPIATGTDAASLFDEIEALLRYAGLTPLETLVSATSVGAAGTGVDDEFGSLEAGKVVDVVVYPADPSPDISPL